MKLEIISSSLVGAAAGWHYLVTIAEKKSATDGLFWSLVKELDRWPCLFFIVGGIGLCIGAGLVKRRKAKLLIRRFVKYLHERLLPESDNTGGRTSDCRISVLVPKLGKKLKILCRSDDLRSKKTWSIDPSKESGAGLAGRSFIKGIVVDIPELPDCRDWDQASDRDKEAYCEATNITEETARRLSWRARCYRVLPVRGPDFEPCAVIMFESLEPRKVGTETVGPDSRLETDALYIGSLLYYH